MDRFTTGITGLVCLLFATSVAHGATESAAALDSLTVPAPKTPVSESQVLSAEPSSLDAKRRFGVGFGAGYMAPTGNAGFIYNDNRGPSLDLRAAYWLDPRIAIQLSAENSKHGYNLQPDGLTDVNLFRISLQAKYYFDTTIRPHLIAGVGSYWRTDTIGVGSFASNENAKVSQNAMGFNFGAGIEFEVLPGKASLQLEAVAHDVAFADDRDPKFMEAGVADRTGLWIVTQAALVFTW
ncbi:MAG: porin family protein [Deltaproteobacteria bacterium]|nr:porin family protein [Deltaproteobacteria bacterium]